MSTKREVDELVQLDIRKLKRRGIFANKNISCEQQWWRGGKDVFAITSVARFGHVLLADYIALEDGQQPIVLFGHQIPLMTSACNYGGVRYWMQCVACSKRVGVLYAMEPRFVCRKCAFLCYPSQNETVLDRAIRRTRKIRARLRASDNLAEPIFHKPKNMHWRSFNRLLEKEASINPLSLLS